MKQPARAAALSLRCGGAPKPPAKARLTESANKRGYAMKDIIINTDGACSGNPGPGGFAAIIEIDGEEITVSGGQPHTTNNQMELGAVIAALDYLRHNRPVNGRNIEVRSDSSYVVDAHNKGWLQNWQKRGWRKADNKPLPNTGMWQELCMLARGLNIQWTWVRGHSGEPMNERCDAIAVEMAGKAISQKGRFQEPPTASGNEAGQESPAEPTVAPKEEYPEPNTGDPIRDAIQYAQRAETCAELSIYRYESGDAAGAWDAMRTALDQLKRQQALLNSLTG